MNDQEHGSPRTTQLDRLLAKPMFAVTIVFLVGLAIWLHMNDTELWQLHGHLILWSIAVLWLTYPLEAVIHWLGGGRRLRQNLLYCIVPIARLGGRDHVEQTETWLPWLGWQTVTRSFTKRVMQSFSLPMIVVALLVIPLIVFGHFFDQLLRENAVLNFWVAATSAFIWACFVFEFVIVVSATDRRWDYCRQNWINLVVIILPAIAFLRVLQIGRLFALNQMMRTARVFRLRGVLFRAWRAIVALEVLDKILRRNPSLRLQRCKRLVSDKEEELGVLRQEVARLEKLLAVASSEGISGDQSREKVCGETVVPSSSQPTARP